MPNMAAMSKNSSAKATEIGWRSTPNLKFNFTNDIRKPESSAHHPKGLLDGRLCASAPNIPVHPKSSGETVAEVGWRSTPNLKFPQVTSGIWRPESLKNCNSKGFIDGRCCVSTPNIPVHQKLAGETAADVGWRSMPNLKCQQVTGDVRKSESPRHKRPRRSFWRQTKKFVKRLFCCCSIDTIDQ